MGILPHVIILWVTGTSQRPLGVHSNFLQVNKRSHESDIIGEDYTYHGEIIIGASVSPSRSLKLYRAGKILQRVSSADR